MVRYASMSCPKYAFSNREDIKSWSFELIIQTTTSNPSATFCVQSHNFGLEHLFQSFGAEGQVEPSSQHCLPSHLLVVGFGLGH
jgi:hypothetical protein